MHWSYCDTAAFSSEELHSAYLHLSPSRKAHIDRLRQQEDKLRSLTAELLVQKLLKEHCGVTDAVLHRNPNGQPYLTGCDLHVTISHSDQMVACALSADPIGIDIERIRPLDFKICRHLCTEEEKAYCGEDLHRLFEIWTAKEAYFKKQGTGITDLKSVNILPLNRQIHIIGDYMVQIV
jgi:4'-phosphopantetheinyl transferase